MMVAEWIIQHDPELGCSFEWGKNDVETFMDQAILQKSSHLLGSDEPGNQKQCKKKECMIRCLHMKFHVQVCEADQQGMDLLMTGHC